MHHNSEVKGQTPTNIWRDKQIQQKKNPTAKVQLLKAEDSEPIGGTEQWWLCSLCTTGFNKSQSHSIFLVNHSSSLYTINLINPSQFLP